MEFVKNEREAIQRAMSYIENQQTRLQDDYMKLVERQRELDEIEQAQSKVPEPVAVAAPEVPLSEAILSHNRRFGHTDTAAPETTLVGALGTVGRSQYISDMERLKDIDHSKRVVKNHPTKSSYRDIQRIAEEIIAVLKDAGVPVKAKELIKRLEDRGVDMANKAHSTLYQAKRHDKRIEKAAFGYYQYRG